MEGTPCPLDTATPDEIIAAIQEAGVVGLGGAAFPTHVKLKLPEGKSVDTLIINGAECEPYLTTDHRVMLEQRDDIFMGIRYLLKATGAAARRSSASRPTSPTPPRTCAPGCPPTCPARVETLRVKYPQGAEKMLITALLGREVPSGGLPLDVHALVRERGHDGRDRPAAAARPRASRSASSPSPAPPCSTRATTASRSARRCASCSSTVGVERRRRTASSSAAR